MTWDKIDDTVCWFLAVVRGYLKALWQRIWWNIRWPFLWIGYQARQIGLFFRTLKLTAAYIEDEGKHTVVIRLKWESEVF
jgi:hypothetical protein